MTPFVVNADPDMVYAVSKNMRERDFEEMIAVSFTGNREELASELARIYGGLPMAVCFGIEDRPVCILSALVLHPGVWSIGLWATDEFQKVGHFVTRWALKRYFPALRAAGMHRLECKSIVGYNEIHDWLRYLGFLEGNIEKMFGKNGEDFITFYWHDGLPIGKKVK